METYRRLRRFTEALLGSRADDSFSIAHRGVAVGIGIADGVELSLLLLIVGVGVVLVVLVVFPVDIGILVHVVFFG